MAGASRLPGWENPAGAAGPLYTFFFVCGDVLFIVCLWLYKCFTKRSFRDEVLCRLEGPLQGSPGYILIGVPSGKPSFEAREMPFITGGFVLWTVVISECFSSLFFHSSCIFSLLVLGWRPDYD